MLREYFEDCKVGEQVVTPGRTITEADVVMFAAFSGDWNSVHTDAEYARTTSFGQRIAHGLLGLVVGTSLLSRVAPFTFWPRSLVGVTEMGKVRFVRPIFIGDTIHLEAEIVEMIALRDDAGIITTRLWIKNQADKLVTTFRLKIMAGRRPAEADAPRTG